MIALRCEVTVDRKCLQFFCGRKRDRDCGVPSAFPNVYGRGDPFDAACGLAQDDTMQVKMFLVTGAKYDSGENDEK